ncbi:uncharacterized protein N7477_001237 [Penicillium maclennaniae]|uniref:uncharacterized protein n=1 Tax=Penicillium maclennaniae TaxID=1343394 RepID=UPI00254258D9|nr:uncharacterized protein N7477_001237 [Penicillium maclennaniae]KAJ5684892.1 hypothetical protein N7477_001237 [Penicillium maclennaniae]
MPMYEEELAQRGEKSQVGQTVTVPTEFEGEIAELYRPTMFQSNITILSCYIANFSDGFQNTLANPTNVIFKVLLGPHVYSSDMKTRTSNSLIIGAILGVVVLGYNSDMVSRRGGLLSTSSLVAIGIAGFGVGGEYPPSAAVGLEESDGILRNYRGPLFVSFTTLMATLAGHILQIIYLISLVASDNNLTVAFHTMYSIATILPVIIMVLRVFMVDSSLFHHSNLVNQRRSPRLFWLLARRIMSGVIISSLVENNDIRKTAVWQIVLAVLPVPAVMLGAWLTNSIGRRYTGILGFVGYMILGFIIGGTYTELSRHIAAFVVLYELLQAFGHMGPGATIGLISSEVFPTAMRGMGYGIATAFGRTGAAVGTECFTHLQDQAGKSSTFYLAGGVAVLGIFVYYLLPESSEIDLEKEDRSLEDFLAEKGYKIGGK